MVLTTRESGKRHGQGTFVKINGSVYQGDWVDGKLTGKGICKNLNGTYYEGEWLNDQPHGKGQETFPDKSSYVGSFEHG